MKKLIWLFCVAVFCFGLSFLRSPDEQGQSVTQNAPFGIPMRWGASVPERIDLRTARTPLPPAEITPWEAAEYSVLPTVPGGIRIMHNGSLLYANRSQVQGGPCSQHDKRHCFVFPNGQRVVPSEELLAVAPLRAKWDKHYGVGKNRS